MHATGARNPTKDLAVEFMHVLSSAPQLFGLCRVCQRMHICSHPRSDIPPRISTGGQPRGRCLFCMGWNQENPTKDFAVEFVQRVPLIRK